MSQKIKTIVIDPGHGKGERPTYPDGACETDIAWNVAKKLETLLKGQNHEVHLTKNSRDDLIGPSKRGLIAVQKRADIFVSIHCNAATNNPDRRGVFGIFYGKNPSENRAADNEICAPNGRRLARLISQEISAMTGIPLAGVNGAMLWWKCPSNLGVLTGGKNWKRTNAACLIEAGFLTNEHDRKIMREEKAQDQYALGCARGIYRFAQIAIPDEWDTDSVDDDLAPGETVEEIHEAALKQAVHWAESQGVAVPEDLEAPLTTGEMLVMMQHLMTGENVKRPD